eukprot:12670201-Alexandrium_andersonii.AAC.1
MPMPPEVEQVDMENFGRSRREVSNIVARRVLGQESQFDGASGRPRPSPIRVALKLYCSIWHHRSSESMTPEED